MVLFQIPDDEADAPEHRRSSVSSLHSHRATLLDLHDEDLYEEEDDEIGRPQRRPLLPPPTPPALLQRPLSVGDLIMLFVRRTDSQPEAGFLSVAPMGDLQMRCVLQPPSWDHVAARARGDAAPLSSCAASVFEVYRCASEEDLYRASVMKKKASTITRVRGSPVLFQQAIQLRHHQRRKLLSVDTHSTTSRKGASESLGMDVLLRDEHHHSSTATASGAAKPAAASRALFAANVEFILSQL